MSQAYCDQRFGTMVTWNPTAMTPGLETVNDRCEQFLADDSGNSNQLHWLALYTYLSQLWMRQFYDPAGNVLASGNLSAGANIIVAPASQPIKYARLNLTTLPPSLNWPAGLAPIVQAGYYSWFNQSSDGTTNFYTDLRFVNFATCELAAPPGGYAGLLVVLKPNVAGTYEIFDNGMVDSLAPQDTTGTTNFVGFNPCTGGFISS